MPPREKILVIDDQAEVRDFLATVLDRAGFEVVKGPDGEKALKRFPRERDAFALAILDLDLGPGKPDGIATLKDLKKIAPELPVIMLSGKGSSAAVRAAWKAGAADFLEKDTQIEDRLELSLEKTKELV